ncbi:MULTISPECIES: heme o synthase [Novosphingobium]|uniref:heme o synthase n=1 Tax=Novosphingobium TaxID=165696 RepID=UPI00048E2C29|nr:MULTISPECIES: heme o synthase [Novosphingobium]KPF52393.1 protoheme IX farnesyltransferase [Novosphingobium sp. AAP1]MBB3360182.1 protoheme IX farnesyltransferase [Novosphingobium sp. BK256]MBB3376639.1 protoheme IX farnesyltransferase [Novosphingobium sp. BK280]MBB3381052.1 protoheme IX farnesyltransferase [Novosphingobium sp. BK258]MBB3422703.1 protoheme IX farnesyltransferase [Novosphingobium sp. BK267]
MDLVTTPLRMPADWRDFFALTKPRVMTLVIFTGLCGLLAAPGEIHPVLGFAAILCIAVGAGGAAALNQWWEADLDAGMKRTARRPVPAGRMDRESARDFGFALSGGSVVVMGLAIGWLAAAILAISIFYYAWVYTVWLKPRTPQNIVIGGGAGAFPPLIGWVAVTGHITWMPVVLFLIIFLWTPPHFWALALFVQTDYAKVGIPMLPVVAGEKATRRQILFYTLVLVPVSLVPWALGGAGLVYGVAAALLGLGFLVLAMRVGLRDSVANDKMKPEKRLFGYSVLYLFALFAALVLDRFAGLQGWA